jgi:hypothetical protein
MGGNAIKMSRRYEAAEYSEMQREIEAILQQNPALCYYFVRPYQNKPSFGDMDILIQKKEDKNWKNTVLEMFPPYQEISRSSDVWSFNYKELQVDLIFIPEKEWELAKWFFDFNDLGALAGKIARFLKLKFGFQGLEFELYYKERKKTFLISLEPEKIYEFLGFDVERYKLGFENLEDVFDYVAHSKYFNNATFEKIIEKEGQRAVDAQRPTYQKFLAHISKLRVELPRPEVSEVLQKVKEYFGQDLPLTVEMAQQEIDEDIEIHEKFNGKHLIEHLGVTGKELGELLGKFNDLFETKKSRYAFIKEHSLSEILEKVREIRQE